MGGSRRRLGWAAVAVVLLGVTALAAPRTTAPATAMPEPERHPSGLEIFYEEPDYAAVELPPDLERVLHLLEAISQQQPDDFGFPATDGVRVSIPLATQEAEELWAALPSRAEGRLILEHARGDRDGPSRTETLRISQEVFELASEDHPEAEAWSVRIDPLTGRPVLGVVEPTQGLIEDLVARYGTDLVQLEIADPSGVSQTTDPSGPSDR